MAVYDYVFIYVLEGNLQWTIAEFVRWLIVWKVPSLGLNSTSKMLYKTNANQYNDDKYQVKHCVHNEAINNLYFQNIILSNHFD